MNFQKLFEDYKVEYSLKTNKGWVNTKCVYCGGSSYKLGFNPKDDFCTCFACGYHNLNETLSILLKIPKYELNDILPQYAGRFGIIQQLNKKAAIKHLELPGVGFTKAERKYLERRHFDPDYLQSKYHIVGGGIVGRWKHRIIIPIIYNGKVVSWTARSILSKDKLIQLDIPRYKHLSIEESVIDPKKVLFNLDNCASSEAVLLEGPFDVLRFGDNSVCSFGTSLTQEQIKIITNKFKILYIIFDNEPKAQAKARRYGLQIAALGVQVEIINACEDFGRNDIGECNEEEIKTIKKSLNIS